MNDTSSDQPSKPPLTAGGIFMVLFGGLLMLGPGGCSLFFGAASILEKLSGRRDQYGLADFFLVVSAIGLLVAALGFWLIRVGLRRRNARSASS